MSLTTADKDLLSKFDNPPPNCNIVTAGFENEVPARHRVKIIAVGANFDFDPGATESLGPYRVSIGSGGDYLLMSSCREDCCVRIFGALTLLHEPSGQTQTLTEFRHPGDADSCLLATRFVLEIQENATKQELANQKDGVPLFSLSIK